MPQVKDEIYKKIETVAKSVKKELQKKGFVIPVKNDDGSISLENYTIRKDNNGFYCIYNSRQELVVEKINLPQTAAVLANGLALGKWLDDKILKIDQTYGHKMFENVLFDRMAKKNLAEKNIERAEILYTKAAIAKAKTEQFKHEVIQSFEKLRRLR